MSTTTKTLALEGMSCGHCVAAVQKALAAVPGVTVEAVKIGSATVAFDGGDATLDAIGAALDDAGYPVVAGR